jgi:capsular polysaccharide biosynthesis protein
VSKLEAFPENQIKAARLGRSWPLFDIKQALNSKVPPVDAIRLLADLLECPEKLSLRRKPIVSLAAAIASDGADYVEIEAGGETVTCAAPRVIGAGNHRDLHGTSRTLYCGSLANVRVRGRSQFVERDGDILLDFEGEELVSLDDQLELDGAILSADTEHANVIHRHEGGGMVEIDAAFSLLGPNSFAFGHWMAEYLPRLAVALEWGRMPTVPVLIDAGMPDQHRQALEHLLPLRHPIMEVGAWQCLKVRRLWVAPTYYYAPLHPVMNARYREEKMVPPPQRFARIAKAMRDRFAASIGNDPGGPARIFLSRGARGHRKLLNQPAIEAIARRGGFEALNMATLDFARQFQHVVSATHLTGPEGSAFFTAFFANPGTKLLILNHTHTEMLPSVTALMEACGMEVTVLTGPFRHENPDYPHFGDYEIEEGQFTEFIAGWTAAP